MYNILVVDDEKEIRTLIKKYADFEGYSITEAENGIEALDIFSKKSFDIVVVDVMMPELDGFSVCKQIRKISNLPIIMLSARGEEYDKIHAFELRVDDYVVKPFSPKELMMRINAIISRCSPESSLHEVFRKDGLTIDFSERSVYIDNERIDMSPKEYELLFFFARNKNLALTREKLIASVWGYDYYGDDRTLDTHIKLLRKSLRNYSGLIVTLRGVGYRFEG